MAPACVCLPARLVVHVIFTLHVIVPAPWLPLQSTFASNGAVLSFCSCLTQLKSILCNTGIGGLIAAQMQSCAGTNQLQSLTSFGNQLLAPRKRRGPLYLRTGPSSAKAVKENGLSQPPGFGGSSDSKVSQQVHWQTLGNGNFSDHFTNSPQNRNGFNTNGLQTSLFAGAHAAAMAGDEQQRQAQAYSNTLPANGSLFSHSS